MKKSLVLLLSMGLVLSSCGGKKEDKKDEDLNPNSQVSSVAMSKESKTKEEAKDKKDTKDKEKKSEDKASAEDASKDEAATLNKTEENSDQKKDSKEENDKDQDKQDKEVETINSLEDGTYYTTIMSSQKMENGHQVYGISIDGNKLTADGNFFYAKEDKDVGMENQSFDQRPVVFELTDDTVFRLTGGTGNPEVLNRKDFLDYFEKCKDSGLGFIVVVKDGKVVTVSIAS